MKKVFVIALFGVTTAGSAGQLPADLGDRLVTGYIMPATRHFADAAAQLEARLQTWCARPDAADRDAIARDFGALAESWAGIEFLRFGPLVAANRFERIFFWPDARGVMVRQVQAVLTQPDIATNAQTLATRSVAVQGLPALEYVLYREGGLLTAPQSDASAAGFATGFAIACAYAQATAHNLAGRGAELADTWRGHDGAVFATPDPGNPVYRSQREVANEAVKAISTNLQFLRDVKLAPALGDAPDQATAATRARRAPFWRSGLTTRTLRAQVEGLQAFYQAGGWRYATSEAWIDENLTQELARARNMLAGLPAPISELLRDADHHRELHLVALQLGNVKHIVDENMAPAFGVTIGFNALDGD